jgi:hypothetical protein
MENLILRIRKQLRDDSDLGEFGAAAIHRALAERGRKRSRRCARLVEFSCVAAPSTDGGVFVVLRPPKAGICPVLLRGRPNSTVSISSKTCICAVVRP